MEKKVIEITDIKQLVSLVTDIPDGVIIRLEMEGDDGEEREKSIQPEDSVH